MVAGWDGLFPASFSELHPRFKTPVRSLAAVVGVSLAFGAASLIEVGQQEANQILIAAAMACSGLYYLMMFAVILWGRLDAAEREAGTPRLAARGGVRGRRGDAAGGGAERCARPGRRASLEFRREGGGGGGSGQRRRGVGLSARRRAINQGAGAGGRIPPRWWLSNQPSGRDHGANAVNTGDSALARGLPIEQRRLKTMKKTLLPLAAVALMSLAPMSASAAVRVFVGGGRPVFYGGGFYAPYWGRYWGPSYRLGYYPNAGEVKLDTKMKDAQVFINGAYAGTTRTVADRHSSLARSPRYQPIRNALTRNERAVVDAYSVIASPGSTLACPAYPMIASGGPMCLMAQCGSPGSEFSLTVRCGGGDRRAPAGVVARAPAVAAPPATARAAAVAAARPRKARRE